MAKYQKKQSDTTEKAPTTPTLAALFGQMLLEVGANELSLDQAEERFRFALGKLDIPAQGVQVHELDFTYGRLHNALPYLHQAFKRALGPMP